MKYTLVTFTILAVCSLSSFAAPPAPLIPAPVEASAKTLADKQADATKRIDAQILQLQSSMKGIIGAISREINSNREGLTPEQVLAGLGATKAASLQQAQADIVALANKYAPGTFAPAATPAPKTK